MFARVLSCTLVAFVVALVSVPIQPSYAQEIHGQIPQKVTISKKTVKRILRKKGYKKIKIIEIDYEIYDGKKVYEADFLYRGKEYEAAISLEKKLLYVQEDRDD